MWWVYLVLIIGGLVVLAAAALAPQILDGRRAKTPPENADLERAVATVEAELKRDLEAADAFARDPTPDNLRGEQEPAEHAWP